MAHRIGNRWLRRGIDQEEWLFYGVTEKSHTRREIEGREALFTQTRYQFGSLRRRKRATGPDAWEFRYYETIDGNRNRVHVTIGTTEEYSTETAAREAVEARLMKLNSETHRAHFVVPTVRSLIDRYREEELSQRYSTQKSYESILGKHIEAEWGDYPLDEIKPMAVERWFRQLELAPKTKAHIKSLMHLLFRCAERWEYIELGKNPIAWVRVKGCTKRLRRPRVLTKDEICALLPRLSEPFRTMVIVAQCLGLRVSEIMGLQWGDFDFANNTLLVRRSVVHGRVGSKTGADVEAVFQRLRSEAERLGEDAFKELHARHKQRLKREQEKGRYAFHVQREALNRIGLPEVRQHRLKRLEEEERAWAEELRKREHVLPQLQPVILLRVEAGNG